MKCWRILIDLIHLIKLKTRLLHIPALWRQTSNHASCVCADECTFGVKRWKMRGLCISALILLLSGHWHWDQWLLWRFSTAWYGTVRYGTVRYGSLLGGFPLGTVPGTWYFFSTTSVEVPCEPYRYQNVTCKLCWSLIGLRKSSLLRHWTCHTRPSSTVIPARFKSAQPAKDRTQLLFKQTHIFASTTK